MKIIRKVNETYFTAPFVRDYHHKNHTMANEADYLTKDMLPYMTVQEYEERADELSNIPVYTSDIDSGDDVVGFVNDQERIIKYCIPTKEMVVYKCTSDDQGTISYYSAEKRSYLRKLKAHYKREIQPEDDKYNTHHTGGYIN